MICRCFGQVFDLAQIGRRVGAAAEVMAGVGDYDAYAAHTAATHPDQPIMTRDGYFRARQSSRYGTASGLRCC